MEEFILISAVVSFILYLILGLAIYRGMLKALRPSSPIDQTAVKPKVSVIVAVRNEAENIPSLLEYLLNQNYENYEIIIADDNSNDDTNPILKKYTQKERNFKIIEVKDNKFAWGPKKNAIHTGIIHSSGDIILTTDADCRPQSGWILAMASEIINGAGIVIGYSPIITGAGLKGRMKSLEALASGIVSAGLVGLGKPFMAVGRSFGYLKELYLSRGGFGETGKIPAGDDDLLLQRLSCYAKTAFVNAPNSKVPSFDDSAAYLSKKKRHFAVARSFPPVFIAMGGIVFIFLLSLTALLVSAFYDLSYLPIFISLFILKILIDFVILKRGSELLSETFKVTDFLIVELLQFPFTLILQPLSLFGKVRWKGRTL